VRTKRFAPVLWPYARGCRPSVGGTTERPLRSTNRARRRDRREQEARLAACRKYPPVYVGVCKIRTLVLNPFLRILSRKWYVYLENQIGEIASIRNSYFWLLRGFFTPIFQTFYFKVRISDVRSNIYSLAWRYCSREISDVTHSGHIVIEGPVFLLFLMFLRVLQVYFIRIYFKKLKKKSGVRFANRLQMQVALIMKQLGLTALRSYTAQLSSQRLQVAVSVYFRLIY